MNCLVCGRMKEGKTTFALYLAREWSSTVIVWDPRHMIDGAVYVSDAEELEDAIYEQEWKKGPIIFRPDGLRLSEDFDAMCQVLFTPPERFGAFALVIDEASDMQSAHKIAPHLSRCIRQHPRTVLIVQTTHSLQDWHRASRDLTNELYCFRQVGLSCKAVVDFCDGSRDMELVIKNLPRHHLIKVSFEASSNEDEYDLIDDPQSWFSTATSKHDQEETHAV
jgi:hypothetical protein